MKKKRYNIILSWVPAIIWMATIYILSSMTGNDLQHAFPMFSDFNWGHFVAYFILCITYYVGLKKYLKGWKLHLSIILLSLFYGLTDEFHQFFVPTRTPQFTDLFADIVGASLASLGLYVWRMKLHGKYFK